MAAASFALGPLATVALAALVLASAAAQDRLPGPLPAQVVEVVDGDTLTVRVRIWLGQELVTRVRLEGIDAPELRSPCDPERRRARQARERLADLVGDVEVLLHDITYDKYGGRVRARVRTAAGRDVAQAPLAAGLATPYPGPAPHATCAAARPR